MTDPAIPGDSAGARSSTAPSGTPGAAGAALLGERRRQGLSVGDISRQLKLSVRQVEALERDDFSAYKSPVFVHGFIRNYAKLLGLDPDPLIRAADSMLNPEPVAVIEPREPPRVREPQSSQAKLRYWPAALTVLLVVVALSVYFGGRRPPQAQHNAPTVAAREKPATPPKIPAETKAEAEKKAKVETRPAVEAGAAKAITGPIASPVTARPETQAAERTDSAIAAAGGAVAAESVTRLTVRMIFEQDSWVEIKDRDGNTIFGQLNAAGSRRSVSGEPPLSVVVGNAAGVRIFQGDKSIDLAPHTRVDVARLTLE